MQCRPSQKLARKYILRGHASRALVWNTYWTRKKLSYSNCWSHFRIFVWLVLLIQGKNNKKKQPQKQKQKKPTTTTTTTTTRTATSVHASFFGLLKSRLLFCTEVSHGPRWKIRLTPANKQVQWWPSVWNIGVHYFMHISLYSTWHFQPHIKFRKTRTLSDVHTRTNQAMHTNRAI